MSFILRTHNLTKAFDDKEVVSNVSMNIKKGEIYGFLGANGAGKTTVMKMMTNLVKPTAGEVEIFGEKLTETSYEVLKKMGSIIECPVFYDKMTARENMELHCEYMGYYEKNAIDRALELVNLIGTGKKPVKDFSLGMKQRLGIARAICTKPEILILDEPINGLDPIGIKEIRNLLKSFSKEQGMTIIISSHILAEVEQIADTIGVINSGRLIEELSMKEIREENMMYIEIVADDCRKAAFILENKLKVKNFRVVEDAIRIYDSCITQKEINKALVLEDIEIKSITSKNNSLEEHFISIVNGGELSA